MIPHPLKCMERGEAGNFSYISTPLPLKRAFLH